MNLFPVVLAVLVLAFSTSAQPAQAPPSQRFAGAVVNSQANEISLQNTKGDILTFTTNDRTQILHALPGENDPKKWNKLTLSEIGPGDEALAYFRGSAGQKPLLATSLVIRTKADLAQLAQKQLDDWKKRGTAGTVSAIDPVAKTLTIGVGRKSMTVQASDNTQYRRYSLDSAKVSDARPSTFEEIKTGDQVNVLGDRNEAGTSVKAESIYAGTFRQLAATIVSIDPASGDMKVTDLAAEKPLVIRVSSDSIMKKLPDQIAQSLARRYGAGARGGAGGGDIGQMLDGLAPMHLADLKPKDAIMVSTTMGSDPTRVTAILLLAGVEPILTAAPNATRDIMSGWNLGAGGEGN